MVASQNPSWFLYNTGYDPLQPQNAILTAEQIDLRVLAEQQVTHLLLQSEAYKAHVAQDDRFHKLADFDVWSWYAVRLAGE